MRLRPNAPGKRGEESAATPRRLFEARVLLDLKVSAHAEVVLESHHLRVRATFGELIVPYTQIQRVKRGMPSSVAVEVAGAQIWFDAVKGSQVDQLLAHLSESTSATKSPEH